MKPLVIKNIIAVIAVLITITLSYNVSGQQIKTNIPAFSIKGIEGRVITECDFINEDDGCYTINFRVYTINVDTEQKTLIANENVRIGDCYNELIVSPMNAVCDSGYLNNGDFVYANSTNNSYCLLDLLRDESLYQHYLISVNGLLKLDR